MISGSTLSPAPCCTALDHYLISMVSDVSSVNWVMLFWMEVESGGFRTGQTWTGIYHYNLAVSKLSPRETHVLILEENTKMHLSHWPGLNKLPGSVWFSTWYIVSAQEIRVNMMWVIVVGKMKLYALHKPLEIWTVWGK